MPNGSDRYRLGKHRGYWVAIIGREANKRRIRIGKIDAIGEQVATGKLRKLIEDNASSGKNRITVDYIMGRYIEDRIAEGIVNIQRIREVRKTIQPIWGDYLPAELKKTACRTYITRRRRTNVSNATIRQELAYLQAALNFAVLTEIIDKAPKLSKPPPPRARDYWLTHDEVARLIESTDAPHIKLFIVLSIATAARPKHLLELTWDRVDLRGRVIELDNPDKDRTQKGRARVPINETALEHLTIARAISETSHVIEYDGKPILSVRSGITAAARRAGLPRVTQYVLRHTAGTWMARKGVPLAEIAEFMGHTSIETTRRHYAKHHPDHLMKAAGALEITPATKPTLEHGDDDE